MRLAKLLPSNTGSRLSFHTHLLCRMRKMRLSLREEECLNKCKHAFLHMPSSLQSVEVEGFFVVNTSGTRTERGKVAKLKNFIEDRCE